MVYANLKEVELIMIRFGASAMTSLEISPAVFLQRCQDPEFWTEHVSFRHLRALRATIK